MAKYSHLLTPAGMAVIFLFLLWDRKQLRNEIAGLRQAWLNA